MGNKETQGLKENHSKSTVDSGKAADSGKGVDTAKRAVDSGKGVDTAKKGLDSGKGVDTAKKGLDSGKGVDTAKKAVDYVKGAGFKYMHLGKITMDHRDLERRRLEVLQKIGLQCVQSIQSGSTLDDTLFKSLYDSYTNIVESMDALETEKISVKKIDPASVKSSKYDTE